MRLERARDREIERCMPYTTPCTHILEKKKKNRNTSAVGSTKLESILVLIFASCVLHRPLVCPTNECCQGKQGEHQQLTVITLGTNNNIETRIIVLHPKAENCSYTLGHTFKFCTHTLNTINNTRTSNLPLFAQQNTCAPNYLPQTYSCSSPQNMIFSIRCQHQTMLPSPHLRKASSMGVPILMLGMRLSCRYDSVLKLTKSTQKLSILRVAVSKCLDLSGFEAIRATLLVLDPPFF